VFVFLLAAGAACGSDGDSSTPAASTSPTTAAESPATTVEGSPSVKLEEAGAEPRQPLVLRIASGSRSKAALESTIGLELTIDGETLPSPVLPGSRTVLDQRVDRVEPDGTIHYSVSFTEVSVLGGPGVDPELVKATQDALDQLAGLEGTGTVDSHGGNQSLTFDTASITDPALEQLIDSVSSQVGNLAAPFPREPVGKGARWTVTSTATINGITMNTTNHYTLRSRTGDHYEIDVTQEASAPPGAADIPNLPAGTRATITSFELESTGKVSGDLTRQLPLTSTISGSGDGVFTIVAGPQRAKLEQHLTLDFSIEAV